MMQYIYIYIRVCVCNVRSLDLRITLAWRTKLLGTTLPLRYFFYFMHVWPGGIHEQLINCFS
jgi:hypothetical protein